MTKRQQTVLGVALLMLAAIGGGFWAQWRHLDGQTPCPHCAAIANYVVQIQDGRQNLTCQGCGKEFAAQVVDGRFTPPHQKR